MRKTPAPASPRRSNVSHARLTALAVASLVGTLLLVGTPAVASAQTTVGPITTAVIVGTFTDSTTQPDMNAIRANFQGNPGHDVVSFFSEASYGRMTLSPSFFGPYALNLTMSAGCDANNLIQTLMNAANTDVNYTQFRRLLFVVDCPGDVGTSTNEAPMATPDGTVTLAETLLGTTYATRLYYVVHELSHTLGAFNHHANFFECRPDAFEAPARFESGCVSAEYGDEFDVLGGGMWDQVSHLNPFHKASAGWFGPGQFPSVTGAGTQTFTIAPYEQANGVLALNIPRGLSGTAFTVEYRQPIGFDSWMGTSACPRCTVTQGASIRLSNFYVPGSGGGGDTHLIDTTPGSILSTSYYPIEDGRDGALLPGKTFTDPEYGISITAVSATSAGLTVQVTIPSQLCTHAAPNVVLTSPTSATASAGQTRDYTFTLTNADSSGCAANTFRYFPDHTYPDVTMVASPDFVVLAPGASAAITVSVSSASTTVDGSYGFSPGQFLGDSLDAAGTRLPWITYQLSSAGDTTPPTAPTNLTAQPLGAGTVVLSWSPSTDNVGVLGYAIRRSDGIVLNSDGPSYLDTSVRSGTQYSYSVQAFDRKSNLSTAASVTATTPAKTDFSAPSAPVVSASATDHSITVSWVTSRDNVGVAYYSIRPCLVKGCTVAANTTSFTAGGLPARTRYDLQILAVDRDGNYSNFSLGTYTVYTAAAGTSAPSQPQQLISTAGAAGRIDLSWQASSDDQGVAGYDVYRNDRKLTTVTSTSFSDTTVAGNSEYYVQAVDADGSLSAPSPRIWFLIPASPGADTSPPTAAISGPADGSTVSDSVTVDATASDDVGVTKVALYVDGALKGIDTSAPYSFTWDTTAAASGAHWLYVRAYDAAGNYGTSGVTNMTVSNGGGDTAPPDVAIVTPTGGSPVTGPVAVAVSATDNVGVMHVDIAVDGSVVATDTAAPYTANWDATSAGAGSHTITATAYDAAGNTDAASVSVTKPTPADTTAPTVSISAPSDGATVSGTVQVQATAADDVGVAKVEFSVDGTLRSTLMTGPWAFPLDTSSLAVGTHALRVTAYDAGGNSATGQISVNVAAPPPPPADTTAPTASISAPSDGATVSGAVQVQASAADDVGVTKVEFSVDGTLRSTLMTGPWTFPLDTSSLAVGTHALRVTAYDAGGNSASGQISVNIAAPPPPPADTSVPTTPASVKVLVAGTTQVALTWAASKDDVGVVAYEVYRDGVRVGESTARNYLDSGLTPGTSHTFQVLARDAAGNRSALSSRASAKTVALSTASTGTLSGVVVNPAGKLLANAIVKVTVNGVVKSAKSNNNGVWKLTSVPAGDYSLSFTLTGYQPATATASAISGQMVLTVSTLSP